MTSSPSPPPLPPAPGPPPNPPMYGNQAQQAAGGMQRTLNPGTGGFGGTILGSSTPTNVGSPAVNPGIAGAVTTPQGQMGQKTLLGQ